MKKVISMLMVLVMLVTLSACGNNKDTSGNTPSADSGNKSEDADTADSGKAADGEKALTKLSISHHPALHGVPAYVAIEKGFFKDAGLDVDMTIYLTGASQMEALPSGSWSLGGGGATAGVVGTIGYDVQILGYVGWDGPIDIYVREDSDIYQAGSGHIADYPNIYGTADNWRGKTFLLPQGTTAHLALLGTLDALGLGEADVNIVHMEVPAAQTAFRTGEGDGVGQWINFALTAQSYGWKKASSCADAGVDVPLTLYGSNDIINSDPDTVVAYIKAYMKAWYWIVDNREEATQLYYQFMLEEGVDTTEENCAKLLENYKPEGIDTMLSYYAEDPVTGKTPYYTKLATMLSYFVKMGKYDQEQVDKALSPDKLNSELMVRALNELKAEGYK
jgi:sulfonate transport system substrate-binding protein